MEDDEDIYSRRSTSPNEENQDASDNDGDRSETNQSDDEGPIRSADPLNSDNEDNDEKKNKKDGKKSTKPKGPVRRMLISEDMLSGRNGLTKLGETFKDFEFRGKGKEKEDLSRMLNKFEHWIHMLHPKHPFDQCLERVEFLGLKKKPVKTLLKKLRMGLIPLENSDIIQEDEDDTENVFPEEENLNNNHNTVDEFGSDDEIDVRLINEMENNANRTSPQPQEEEEMQMEVDEDMATTTTLI